MISSDTRSGIPFVVVFFVLLFHYSASSLLFLSRIHFITAYYEPHCRQTCMRVRQMFPSDRLHQSWQTCFWLLRYCSYETSVARRGGKRLSMYNVVESDMSGGRLNQWCNLWCCFRFSSGERNTSVSLLVSKLRFTVWIYLVLFRSWSRASLCHGMGFSSRLTRESRFMVNEVTSDIPACPTATVMASNVIVKISCTITHDTITYTDFMGWHNVFSGVRLTLPSQTSAFF